MVVALNLVEVKIKRSIRIICSPVGVNSILVNRSIHASQAQLEVCNISVSLLNNFLSWRLDPVPIRASVWMHLS